MTAYRKRPITVEAEQWLGHEETPMECVGPAPMCYPGERNDSGLIATLEGEMMVGVGDWIITGVAGEKYPCKDDIFKLTYELAATPPAHEDLLEVARLLMELIGDDSHVVYTLADGGAWDELCGFTRATLLKIAAAEETT